MSRPRINLRFWERGEQLKALAATLDLWWDAMALRIQTVVTNTDPETCPYSIVVLIGQQRGIERMADEPEALFRLRIKHALANARDAGSIVGFERIWQRLGLGDLEQEERIEGKDWDIIGLTVDEKVISTFPDTFIQLLIRLYGLTCRRYHFMGRAECVQNVEAGVFDCTYDYVITEA